MKKKREKKKRSSRNLKINTRIVLTSVLAIVIPVSYTHLRAPETDQ